MVLGKPNDDSEFHEEYSYVEETVVIEKCETVATDSGRIHTPLETALLQCLPENTILSILKQNQESARNCDENGSYPLHIAAQNELSTNVIVALIKAYPEALDKLNEDRYTPRDYHVRNVRSRESLMRPTSCWIEEVEKREYNAQVSDKKTELKNEINKLKEALALSRKKQDAIGKMITTIEPKLTAFDTKLQLRREKERRLLHSTEKINRHLEFIKGKSDKLDQKIVDEDTSEKSMTDSVRKISYMKEAKRRYGKMLNSHERIRRDIQVLKKLVDDDYEREVIEYS